MMVLAMSFDLKDNIQELIQVLNQAMVQVVLAGLFVQEAKQMQAQAKPQVQLQTQL